MQKIIGREREISLLESLFNSGKPEFVAVHGRRRVGKTFLVRELFSDRFAFSHTGLSPAELREVSYTLLSQQLESFYSSLSRYGYEGGMPKDWIQAFDCLIRLLESKNGKRQVVFIDEMPWMDTAKSGFLTAFEHFWNGWGAGQTQLMLIVCGSSTSWVTDKLINSKGGLFNRITCEIVLQPFSLKECEEYYRSNDIVMDRYDQLQSYMIFGGVPYYISRFQKGMSLAQNIDFLCFAKGAQLRDEFDRLFNSLFVNPEAGKNVVRKLFARKDGLLRKDIAGKAGIPSGGGLSAMLRGLEESGFVLSYNNFNGSAKDLYYKLADPFCLFYLTFLDGRKSADEGYWSNMLSTPKLNAWRGLSFENTCFAHIPQIKTALGIAGVHTEAAPWRSRQREDGAQIDMVLDRDDRVTNICEMKFTGDDFTITKSYDKDLRHKMTLFAEETRSRKALHLTIVTTYGLHRNEYSGKVQNVITMDDLFK